MTTRHRLVRPLIASLAGAGLAAGVLTALPPSAAAAPPPESVALVEPAPATSSSVGGVAAPRPYLRQAIDWEPCFSAAGLPPGAPPGVLRMQCAFFAAPMDWRKAATSPPIRIAVSKLPATAQPAKAALFTNPGGPGGPGLDLPALFLAQGRKALLQSQDIYGIDVRGTGASTNATCGGFNPAPLDYRDRSPANLDLVLDQNALLARVCNVKGGRFIDHVTTENTVKDLDLLRQLIRQPRINWIGYSGGTWLGAHYATYFPRQTGRFVLDSNNEFTAPFQKTFVDNQPPGFELRFRVDWLPWVAKHHQRFKLGTTPAQVRRSYERVRAALAASPVDLGAVVVDGQALDNLIAGSLYSKYSFQGSADALSEMAQAFGLERTDRRPAAAASVARYAPLFERANANNGRMPLAADAENATFIAIVCNDTPTTYTRASLIKRSAQLGAKYPLRGWATVGVWACPFWPRPPVTTAKVTGTGLPPMLMVQSARDPATPLAGAVRAHKATKGTRLLVVRNEGDHGVYAAGNACVDNAVERFILTGALPPAGATCEGLPIPPPVDAPAPPGSPTPLTEAENPLERARQLSEALRARG